jgi:hypothetical protein
MKIKILKNFTKASLIGFSGYSAVECYRKDFSKDEIYYFLNGFYRGARSLFIGAIVVFNYKIVI